MDSKKKSIILTIVIFLIVLLYLFSYFLYSLPFKSTNFDTYCHLSIYKALDNFLSDKNFEDKYYPNAFIDDPHLGPNFVAYYIYEIISDFPQFFAIFGMFNISLFILSLYLFIRKISSNDHYSLMAVILILFIGSSYESVGSNYFTIIDILFIAHYPQMLGISLVFLCLWLTLAYFENPSSKLLTILLILFSVTLVIHLVSAGFFLAIAGTIILYRILSRKKLSKTDSLFLFTVLIGLIISSIWYFYNWISFVFNSLGVFQDSPIAQGDFGRFGWNYYFGIIRIPDLFFLSIFGVIGAIKSKNKILASIIITLFLISFSFVIPFFFSIPFYWRFLPILKIFLILGFVYYIINENNSKKYVMLVLFIMILIGLFGSINTSFQRYTNSENTLNRFDFLNSIDNNNGLLYSINPTESCAIQSYTNWNLITVEESHLNAPYRIIESKLINEEFNEAYYSESTTLINKFMEENSYPYILLKKDNLNKNKIDTFLKLNGFEVIYSDSNYILYSRNF